MKNILLVLIIVLLGCDHTPPKLTEAKWSNENLVGYQFVLDDKNIIEEYFFYSNGTVSATIGDEKYVLWFFIKKVNVSAPIYYWEINNKNELVIKDHENKVIKYLILKGSYENNYVVISNNKELIYKRSQ